MNQYRIYACEYHRRDVTAKDYLFRTQADDPYQSSCFVWAIVGENETLVVDCGYTAEVGRRRGRVLHREIEEAFGLAGVDCNEVDAVILTHFHFDHAGCLDLFPKAHFYAQAREMAFWTGPYARFPIFGDVVESADITKLAGLNLAGRLSLIRGSAQVRPGIRLHLTGGHTPGSQIVEVETSSGTAVIASDAVKTFRNLDENLPDMYFHDVPGVLDGYELVRSLAGKSGLIFPGHDPATFERFDRHCDHVAVLG